MSAAAFVIAIGSALLAGIAIGVERQYRQHPAGLRTNALVCVGAAAFVAGSALVGDANSPTRVASYVVSGIGFLGGGVILREGLTVRGLNTAATLWCTAAVGVLCGSGFALYGLAITGTVLAINVGLRPVARWIDARRQAAPDAGAAYQFQVVCVEPRDAAVVRNVILRHVNGYPYTLEVRSAGPDGLPKNSDDIVVTRSRQHGESSLTEEAAKAVEGVAGGAASGTIKGIKKGLGLSGGDKKGK